MLTAGGFGLEVMLLTATSNLCVSAQEKGIRETIDKMAQLASKDPAALRKEATEVAKGLENIGELMKLFQKRTTSGKGGWGLGPKPTGMADDGIEARLQNLGRRPLAKDQLNQDAEILLQMANRTTVIAEIALAKAPTKKEGDKDPKDWKKYAEEMIKSAQDLSKAISAKEPGDLKKAAFNLNAACTNCHEKFRD
jgi:hypothetical protein